MILSEKLLGLQREFREFAEREFTAGLLRRLDEGGQFDWEIYNKMSQAGLMGVTVPAEFGGRGEGATAHVLLMEELARVSPVLSLYANGANSLGSGPLLACGSAAQRAKYLPDVASGKTQLAFCLSEPGAGSDAGALATAAVDGGDCYVLNGRKRFVSGAPMADYALVFARTDPAATGSRGISLFIVDMRLDGVTLGAEEDKMGMRGYPTCDIVFSDVRVAKDCLLGELHAGFAAAMKTLDGGRLGIAAQALGIAQGCLDEAVAYANERRQFGKPIGQFEGVGFMLADMATELQAARELVYAAAALKDADSPDAPVRCAMAKYYAGEMCNRVAYKAMQIFGGYGYIKGSKIERLYRDARVTSIYEGTSQIQQLVISRQLLKSAPRRPAAAPAGAPGGADAHADIERTMAEIARRTARDGRGVIVAVGMGISSDPRRGVDLAGELAAALGGTVCCTRDVSDAQWLDETHMIGQTGKTVCPAVYIALGVSGTAQHRCGVKDAGLVVSVNVDSAAPMSAEADIALAGDLFDVVPAMLAIAKSK